MSSDYYDIYNASQRKKHHHKPVKLRRFLNLEHKSLEEEMNNLVPIDFVIKSRNGYSIENPSLEGNTLWVDCVKKEQYHETKNMIDKPD